MVTTNPYAGLTMQQKRELFQKLQKQKQLPSGQVVSDTEVKTPSTTTAKTTPTTPTPLKISDTRSKEIMTNLTEGLKFAPEKFATREAFDSNYAYGKRNTAEKSILDQFYNTMVASKKPAVATPVVSTPVVDRTTQITSNLEEGLKTSPSLFASRDAFDKAYNYATKPANEKAVLDSFWKTKVESKPRTVTTPSSKPTATTSNILDQDRDAVSRLKQNTITSLRDTDLKNARDNFNNSVTAITKNNEALKTLYGIGPDGKVDMANTGSIAYQVQKFFDDYKANQEKLQGEFSSTRLNQVRGQIRQALGARNIDIRNIPPEQIIALSGDVGAKAFGDIYAQKEKIINNIAEVENKTIAQLNALRERGVISDNELRANVETLRTNMKDVQTAINKQFANDLFGLYDTEKSREEAQSLTTVNNLMSFGQSLGLSGTALSVLAAYAGKYPTSAETIQAVVGDLKNKNSALFKAVENVERANAAAAQFEAQLKLLKSQGSGSGSSSKPAKSIISSTLKQQIAALTGLPIASIDDSVYDAINSIPKEYANIPIQTQRAYLAAIKGSDYASKLKNTSVESELGSLVNARDEFSKNLIRYE